MTTFYFYITVLFVRHVYAGGIGSRKGKGPTKWEGPPAYTWRTILLPQEVIERIAAGVDFGYHLVEVAAEFVYTNLFAC